MVRDRHRGLISALMLMAAVLMAALALDACGDSSPSGSATPTPAARASAQCPTSRVVSTHLPAITPTPSPRGASVISPLSLGMFQTTGSGSDLLGSQPVAAFTAGSATDPTTISLAPGQTHQTMLGFGGTLTDVSAEMLVQKMSSRAYSATMKSLFSPSAGIGLDLLRVPIGGNDFSLGNYAKAAASSNNYNEDPTRGPAGDPLKCFSIAHDREFLIPVLKAALALNPKLALIATPWSAPGWMKSGGSGYDHMDGGSLKTSDMSDYAQYLVDFIKQYRAAGVPIRYLSLDNEPDQNPTDPYPDYPVMHVTWQQEVALAATVKQALQHAGLGAVGIIGFDHNWSLSTYATDLLAHDRDDFAGIAFHCYGGDQPSAAQGFFDRFSPHQGGHGDEPWYETECTPAGPYAANPDPVDASGTPETTEPSNFTGDLGAGYGNTDREDIASVRLGSGSVMLYDLVADTDDGPTMNTSCLAPTCLPLITDDSGKPLYQVGYYVLGQLSQFVAPGAVRIGATVTGDSSLQSVAFKDPDGSLVVLVLNTAEAATPFAINWNGDNLTAQIDAYSVQTYIWNPRTVRVAL